MKQVAVVMLCLTISWLSAARGPVQADQQCPDGQWYDPQLRKCVVPGDGDAGTDREFKRALRAECHYPCGDGWCCPNEFACKDCLKQGSGNKTKCYRSRECWKKR
jgi:hypothetical protein